MLFDSHAHLNFATFSKDVEKIIQRCFDNDIWVMNVGSQLSTSRRAIELAQKYSQGVYATVGVHPIHICEQEVEGDEERSKEKYGINDLEKVIDEVKKLAQDNASVRAIGEVGLDYFHLGDTEAKPPDWRLGLIKEWQKEYLKAFRKLAVELNKPLILHCRSDKNEPLKAYEDLLEIVKPSLLEKEGTINARGVIHCFGANLDIAKKFIDLGFKIGFTGIVTFKNTKELQEVATKIDLEDILIETDCPYLTPEPFRGEKNEPIYVKYIAQKIADLRGIGFDKVAEATTKNARDLFGV